MGLARAKVGRPSRRLALLVVVACSAPAKSVDEPAPPTSDAAVAQPSEPDAGAKQEEVLAAIQKAMNELDEAAQTCWAIAATERFDIEGSVEVRIEIAPPRQNLPGAKTRVMRETTRAPKLLACLEQVLARYRWAPPLYGQTIQLPFAFRAPNGQNTIDRDHVAWNGQGKVSVAVHVDENNTGNRAASIVEVALQAGGSTGMRVAERAELWYFLGAATVVANQQQTPVSEGDMMFVPERVAREVQATTGDVHAVIAIVPGGREGSARAGALPTRELGKDRSAGAPVVLPALKAKTHGPATIYAEPATIKLPVLAASIIQLANGTAIPEHVHATETELLYVLSGAGTLTVDGVKLSVTPTSVVQVPANTKHAFTASADVRALQIYTPAGPEQRFKAKK